MRSWQPDSAISDTPAEIKPQVSIDDVGVQISDRRAKGLI
jgi:hypothetical protein